MALTSAVEAPPIPLPFLYFLALLLTNDLQPMIIHAPRTPRAPRPPPTVQVITGLANVLNDYSSPEITPSNTMTKQKYMQVLTQYV